MAKDRSWVIWFFASVYFACYVPFSALTKALSEGLFPGLPALSGTAILPLSAIASVIGMMAFLWWKDWFRYATQKKILGLSLPIPSKGTFLSGACTALIIVTTTLSYTFEGVSIVFVMLLMRGGVLVIAPFVDVISKRSVRWYSWAGFALSFLSLFVAFSGKGGYAMTSLCFVNVAVYLGCYFIRLRLMSHMAKSNDDDANKRYFVEEQLVGAPLVVLLLAVFSLLPLGNVSQELVFGFSGIWQNSMAAGLVVLIGLFSQGVGIFGGLILLDKSENTYCVPVNRCSSVLAGLAASFLLAATLGDKLPGAATLVGAVLIIAAILFLTLPPMMKRRKIGVLKA